MVISKRIAALACCMSSLCFGSVGGPYLGQEPPGLTPKVFAPGLICFDNRYEQDGMFSPDDCEFCFTVTNANWSTCIAWHTQQEHGQWTVPVRAGFTGSGDVWSPHFSPDGEGLYFASSRPSYPPSNIWRCEKTSTGWSAPVMLDAPVSSNHDEWGLSVLPDRTIYFCSHRPGGAGGCDIWCAPYADGRYTQASEIAILNTPGNDCSPFVPPGQDFLIFNSTMAGGLGNADLYISFKSEDGSWTPPQNLGAPINTADGEMGFSLSPDCKYGFFTRRTNRDSNIYWVDMRAIVPDPNGPVTNLTSGQRFGSIQCAIRYARAGDTLEIAPGWHHESLLVDKSIKIQSQDANDPLCVGGTILQGSADQPVMTLQDDTDTGQITGLTIRGGSVGVVGIATHAMIQNCRIMDNATHGVELSQESKPCLRGCLITGNGQVGVMMVPTMGGRRTLHCAPVIEDCVIVNNGAPAIDGGEPTIIDSILD